MSVHIKLMAARIQLQKTALKKSGFNSFAKYSYFELVDFIPAVQEIFDSLGLSGVISYGQDLATLTITSYADESQILVTCPMSTAQLKGCHEVQNLGAVLSYVRRYLWVTALEILEHDALDSTSGQDTPSKPKQVKLTDEQIKEINVLAKQCGITSNTLYSWLSDQAGVLVSKVAECPAALYQPICEFLLSYKKGN